MSLICFVLFPDKSENKHCILIVCALKCLVSETFSVHQRNKGNNVLPPIYVLGPQTRGD